MPLPSQSISSNVRGRYMYRRRRKRRRPLLLLLICAAAVAGIWWFLEERRETPTAALAVVQANEPATVTTPSQKRPTAITRPTEGQRNIETTIRSAPFVTSEPAAQPAPGWRAAPADEPTAVTTAAPAPPSTRSEPNQSGSLLLPNDAILQARQALVSDDIIEARRILSDAIARGALSPANDEEARYMASAINDRLVFSDETIDGDPYSFRYVVQPGDSLVKIVKRLGLQVDWRFIQRINGLARPDMIQTGQSLKVVTGPFHADVDRQAHRLTLYLGDGQNRTFVREFLVGLGEYDSTPGGLFRVRQSSKMVNPTWTNPRTHEVYAANDPDNPLGEYWMGLQGIEEHNLQEASFGMHGTIEANSIGRNDSMGCIRLANGDIDLVYEVLTEGVSTVWVNESENIAGVPGG